jgi:hypothetical protein
MADEELASYFHAHAVQTASTGGPSSARMECEGSPDQNGGFEGRLWEAMNTATAYPAKCIDRKFCVTPTLDESGMPA